MTFADIVIGIGANLPCADGITAAESCNRAAMALSRIPGLRLVAVSSWYQSAPVPPSGQPPYVNGVAHLAGKIAPESLLAVLHTLEAQAGRIRSVPNAARPLDLDILAMGQLVQDTPDLILPHPRMRERSFVLLPMAELLPEWVHPRSGESIQAMIRALPPAALTPEAISPLRADAGILALGRGNA